MTKTEWKSIYSAFRAAMRGDWAHTRPESFPERVKDVHRARNAPDWLAVGTAMRFRLSGRGGLF